MKSKVTLTLAAVLCCSLLLAVSCGKEPVTPTPSATDTLPFPINANRDSSTRPGDDFWQYCNGGWYAQAPAPPAGEAIGGMYDQSPAIKAMVQTVIDEDPSLKRFYQLSDELYAHSDDAMAYLMALMAQYAKPATREECLRMFGRMIMDGISPVFLTLVDDFKEGTLVGVLALPNQPTYKYSYSDLPDAIKGDLRLIVEGMGMNPEDLYYNDSSLIILSNLLNEDLDGLYSSLMPYAWNALYQYVSEDLNAATGGASPESVRQNARSNLNYLISNRLAVKYITPELKQQFLDIMERLRAAFRERILNAAWMSETTRNNALDKLEKMSFCVGAPDHWYEDCLPDLTQCKSLLEAVHKLMAAKTLLYKHLIGTNDGFSSNITGTGLSATGEMMVTDLTMVNSYYKREFNAVVILPALMLPPLIRTDYSEAYLYGVIVPVAHEITHGFDSNGSNYDAVGRMRNWWTVADKMAFEDEQEKLIQCYSTMEYDPVSLPGQFSNGKVTLAEDIADLGGFLIACDAYIKRLQEQGFTGEQYKEQLRKFHEAYAAVYCMKYSPEKLNTIITADNHSHCRLRVNGVVMNTDLWYELYDVDRNNALFLPEERRAHIW